MGFLRHPKTLQEIRETQDGYCRAKRSRRHLPTVYWDIFVDRSDRNWKKFRKTRWKAS